MVPQASGEYCEAVPDEMSEAESASTTSDAARANHADGDRSGETDVSSARTDLDAIEADLASVEAALVRLDAGTYWSDEVTGEQIPDHLLQANPLLRRVPR